MKHIKTFESFLNEGKDISYWKQYDKGTASGEESWAKQIAKSDIEVDNLYDIVQNWWETESEEAGKGMPFGQTRQSAETRELAHEYFKKYRSISGRVIDAMISQNMV